MYISIKNIKDIYFECEKLDNCIGIEMNYPTGTVNEVIADHVQEETKEILKNTFFLLNAWERVDAVAYKEVLNDMYRKYKDIETDVNLECLSQYCGLIMQREISFETYKAFCRSFVEISESMYGNVEGADLDIVGKVKSYIEKYYMNDIGIGQIAESFDITPNYLSSIFHQRAGCKFVDYLTEVRISNAKRLLVQNQTASVKDIAVMVGYSSSRYFATIFQKITGVKPSAYRKENVN